MCHCHAAVSPYVVPIWASLWKTAAGGTPGLVKRNPPRSVEVLVFVKATDFAQLVAPTFSAGKDSAKADGF